MSPRPKLSLMLLLSNMAAMAAPQALPERMKKLRTWCLTQSGRWWDEEQSNPKACPELAPHHKCG